MKLNRCPFCGGEESTVKVDSGSSKYYIECDCCRARGILDDRLDFAIEYWNNRAEDEPEEEGFISDGSVPEEEDKLCEVYVKSTFLAYARWNKEKREWDGIREGDTVLSWKAVE